MLNVTIELESVLENERHDNIDIDIVQSRTRSVGAGSYVPTTDGGL